MGIQGLLPLLKDCQRTTHIREYKGQTIGIDAYVWLHRGAYSCAQEIATGQQTVKYINYALQRVRLLQHHGIKPYVVFDGGLLPSKQGTEKDRDSRRVEALAKAKILSAEGRHSEARDCYVKAVDVTPQMAYQLIKALIAESIDYVVAPYEADAQLAYLERHNIINGIITEDSDLLVFGCRKVLFKLDSDGQCVEIRRDMFTACKEFSFSGWTDKKFRQMAILSGCDYLESIQGLGIKTAHRLMRKYKTAEKVIKFVRLEGQLKVPRKYEDEFKKAELTFLHQRVFCPTSKKLAHLEDLPDHVVATLASVKAEELKFIGPYLDDEVAYGIARGDLCPLSKDKMIDIAPMVKTFTENDSRALPKPVKGTVTTQNSKIKDFFKASPTSAEDKIRNGRKRDALGEIRPSNLFAASVQDAVRTDAARLPSTSHVKSRFFVSSAKTKMMSKSDILTVEESDTDNTASRTITRSQSVHGTAFRQCQTAEGGVEPVMASTDRESSGPDNGEDHMTSIDISSHVEASEELSSPSSGEGKVGEAYSLPTINFTDQCTIKNNFTLPPMPIPHRPSSPEQHEADDAEFSHVSSPDAFNVVHLHRKLRRYESPVDEALSNETPLEPTIHTKTGTSISSSIVTLTATKEKSTSAILDFCYVQGAQVSLDDSIPCDEATSMSSPLRLDSSDDSQMTEEAITPDSSMLFSSYATPSGTSFVSAPLKQINNFTNALTNQGAKQPIARHALPHKIAKQAIRNQQVNGLDEIYTDDIGQKEEAADFDRRLRSVVVGWRSKFASQVAGGNSKTEKNRMPEHQITSRLPKRTKTTTASRPYKTTTEVQSECAQPSSPITGSSPVQDFTKHAQADSRQIPIAPGKPLLATSTSQVLESFRFRPSSLAAARLSQCTTAALQASSDRCR